MSELRNGLSEMALSTAGFSTKSIHATLPKDAYDASTSLSPPIMTASTYRTPVDYVLDSGSFNDDNCTVLYIHFFMRLSLKMSHCDYLFKYRKRLCVRPLRESLAQRCGGGDSGNGRSPTFAHLLLRWTTILSISVFRGSVSKSFTFSSFQVWPQ